MNKNLTAARTDAYRLLLKTYEVLYKVERQLSDKEARLLIDIAQAIETIEEMIDEDEEEQ
jgi:hypothetical protein